MSERPRLDAAARGTARGLAFEALDEHERSGTFVSDALDARFRELDPPDAERRLATQLAIGVLRRAITLDALLEPHVARGRERVEPELWTLLRIGAYQLALLEGTPSHAAIHATVELTKRMVRPRWTGFANGVLRSVGRMVTDRFGEGPAANAMPVVDRGGSAYAVPSTRYDVRGAESGGPSTRNAAPGTRYEVRGAEDEVSRETAGTERDAAPRTPYAVPRTSYAVPRTRFRLLDRDVFPDPAIDPLGWLSRAFGLPRWLVDRWATRFDFDGLVRLGGWFDATPMPTLRVNPLRTTREELRSALDEAGVAAEPGTHPAAIRLREPTRVDVLPGYAEGWFSVQDESAMSATDLLAPESGERVLDLCAAPGTKTTHLAERMQNQGTLIATDVDQRRLERVADNAARLGLDSIEIRLAANDPASLPEGPFDAILVDVPCSNTGVLGKRPEVRGRLRPADLVELAGIQRSLLLAAIDRLAPGGRVLYSTCSIEPEENSGVVERVLAEREVELVRVVEHVPGEPGDGAYQALLRRTPSA